MRQRWWIAVVAVVGIVLAVLLFPRPDTGGDVPPVDPTNKDPLDFGARDGVPAASARPTRSRPINTEHVGTGPKPGTEALLAARNRPEVVYSGKIIAPWSAIRYVLLKDGTPDAKALADELGDGVMADLRAIRTADDVEGSWKAVEPKMDEAVAKVRASAWASNETVVSSLERVELLRKEFQAAKAGGAPPEGETPAPSAAPTTTTTPPAEE